jgi:DNA-binding response OmpR family regulator
VPAKKKRDALAVMPTVLLVEEDVRARMVIADYLRTCRYRVYEVGSTEEAMQVLSTRLAVDVVFTGVHAGGRVDGFGLAQWVRRRRPDTKVALSSGVRRTAQIAGELCEEGPDLAKPYGTREVERRIRAMLAR